VIVLEMGLIYHDCFCAFVEHSPRTMAIVVQTLMLVVVVRIKAVCRACSPGGFGFG
jgi:hypothetical protein